MSCPTPLLSWIRSFSELLVVISLRSHSYGKRTAVVLAGTQALNGIREVVARHPAEALACPGVHVHAIHDMQRIPAALRIDLLEARHISAHDSSSINAQRRQVLAPKRRSGADDE